MCFFEKILKISMFSIMNLCEKTGLKEIHKEIMLSDICRHVMLESKNIRMELLFSDDDFLSCFIIVPKHFDENIEIEAFQEGIVQKINISGSNELNLPSVSVKLIIPNGYDSLHVDAGSGDVYMNGCTINRVKIQTFSGDIVISNYQVNCTYKLKSKNGEVITKAKHGKSETGELICNSVYGDVIIQ